MHEFFSCTAIQSSQGCCNNYQNKHDDPCPTTVLSLTNLGQCMKFLMHPVLPVHYPVTAQMHHPYKLQSHKCNHKMFNMEPVWLFGVVTLEMDSALKRMHAFLACTLYGNSFASYPPLA